MIKDYKHHNLAYKQLQHKQKRTRSTKNLINDFNLSLRKVVTISLIMITLSLLLALFHDNGPEVIATGYGRLADQFYGKGLLIRDEQVVFAPFAGKVELLAKEGERYRPGEPVMRVKGASGDRVFYNRVAGVISYQVDGLEKTLQPMILDNFQQDYRDFRGKVIQVRDGDQVNAGRPLFKVVDNFNLYLLVEVPKDQFFRYRINEKVWTTMNGIQSIGYVKQILEHRRLFVIELERFPEKLINERWVDLTVLTDAATGVIVPSKAIVVKDGKMGVYRVVEDHIYFHPVQIKGQGQRELVVANIDRGIDILADPDRDLEKYIQEEQDQ